MEKGNIYCEFFEFILLLNKNVKDIIILFLNKICVFDLILIYIVKDNINLLLFFISRIVR